MAQHVAAVRSRKQHKRAGVEPRVTAQLEPCRHGPNRATDLAIRPTFLNLMRAKERVGQILTPILMWVVIEDRLAESWALERKRPATDGIAAPRLALGALVLRL